MRSAKLAHDVSIYFALSQTHAGGKWTMTCYTCNKQLVETKLLPMHHKKILDHDIWLKFIQRLNENIKKMDKSKMVQSN